jgi:hypothetical protein
MAVRRSYKRIFPKGRTDSECFAEVNGEYVATGIAGAIELKYAWSAITGFAQDDKTTLFYTSKCSFLFFPTNVMTVVQKEDIKAMVAQHLVKR